MNVDLRFRELRGVFLSLKYNGIEVGSLVWLVEPRQSGFTLLYCERLEMRVRLWWGCALRSNSARLDNDSPRNLVHQGL